MIELLFALKLLVAIGVVVGLSIITEKSSPKLAGLIAGLPTGSAITLFFIGLENGADFASVSAIYNMEGIVAMLSVLFIYYKTSAAFKRHGLALSAIFSVAGYFVAIYLLHFLNLNAVGAVLLPLAAIVLSTYLFREIRDSKVTERIRLGFGVLFARAVAAAAIILAVIGTAGLAGPEWAGLFTAFPTTTFPLILIIHYTYGEKQVHTIIKHFPVGLASLIAYSLVVSLAYPVIGIYYGTAAAFASAFLVCIFIYLLHMQKGRQFLPG
ncbi:MAG: hypothetical protein Q7T16_04605 [Candidatus Burarchaeum sp.]|nr:hypothetical protein [Candidatus Burarchaeum sp.]MDO8339909.1 hypothetical protein [Candidatus Burarchaeum sp.]